MFVNDVQKDVQKEFNKDIAGCRFKKQLKIKSYQFSIKECFDYNLNKKFEEFTINKKNRFLLLQE